jgi:nicotinamidase/pyrazinamidase
MTSALIIVDIQNDFCAGGPLAVPDAEAIIPSVNELARGFGTVILTQDWHPVGHVSFASSHPGHAPFSRITLPHGEHIVWPDHCVQGTHGAEVHPALEIPEAATVIRKGILKESDSYSAFFDNDGMTPGRLDGVLRQAHVAEIMIVGLATDYCVLQTALDARALGYQVTVIESGCRGIDLKGSVARAWSRMANAGVRRG